MSINECIIYSFPKIIDSRGNLSFIEGNKHIPFSINRIFYVYDIPSGSIRGAHAHKTLKEMIICVSGEVEVSLDDGINQKKVNLNRPWLGLYISPMTWVSTGNFNPGTVYIVLASDYFDESDYYRDYELFLKAIQNGR
jgi:dTDP-4-dehydrorhamnose 3,5-epimerase-like enzyme